MTKFSWIPIYREIAEKLLEHENNQKGLIDIIRNIGEQGLPIISLIDKDQNDKEIQLTEIDPFTFFANWNRGVTDKNRIDIISKIQESLHIKINPPSDFIGIPVMNNMQSWFFGFQKDRSPDVITLLWKLFREALNNNIDPRTFNNLLNIKFIKYNITMGLYWIDPKNYLNLDGVNRAFLKTNNINIDNFDDFETYLKYTNETKNKLNKQFFEISYDAWLHSQNRVKDSETKNNNYWLFAPGAKGIYWEEFFSSNIMAIGWDELGNLKKYKDKKSITNSLRAIYDETKSSKVNDSTSCYSFSHIMQKGDIVFAKDGTRKILGWGVIDSDYYFDDSRQSFKHVRKINWKSKGDWKVTIDNRFALKTITEITKYSDFVSYLKKLVKSENITNEILTDNNGKTQYWWLNANPKLWNLIDTPIGGLQTYTTHNKDGNKRRIYKYFEEVKPRDILIGYVSSPNKQIVAEAVITKGLYIDEENIERIEFKKTESYINPISFEQLKQVPLLMEAEPLVNNQGSLFKLTYEQYDIIHSLIEDANPPRPPEPKAVEYSKEQAFSELFIKPEIIEKATSLLKTKKNIVLQGPPGVGKTFFAKRLAYLSLGKKDDSKIQMIQFHQSYSYEDFIQGYRPTPEGRFELKNGLFYSFCRQAQIDENNNYFFIIDEINRGNLSKIFGELMMLIEYDKRGREFALPLTYSQSLEDKFYIPENLHIIGTMNTADRSLAMVDYALRRRFCFIDLQPAFDEQNYIEFLNNAGANEELIQKINKRLNKLNIRIENDKNLGKGFKIGHSYLCPQKGIKTDQIWYENVIISEIEPLLKEYWFDNTDEAKKAIELLLS